MQAEMQAGEEKMSLEQKLYDKILEKIEKAESHVDMEDITFGGCSFEDLFVSLKGHRMDISPDKSKFILDKFNKKRKSINQKNKDNVIVEFLAEE